MASHAQSLRCLSIPDGTHVSVEFTLNIISKLPKLHTLHIPCARVFPLSPQHIVSSTVTHLSLDFKWTNTNLLSQLVALFPALTKNSISCGRGDFVVADIKKLLQLCSLVNTVCIEFEEVIEELSVALPHVSFVKYSKLDIFAHDY